MTKPNTYDHSKAEIRAMDRSEANRQYYRMHLASGLISAENTKATMPMGNYGVTRLQLLEAMDQWNRVSTEYKYWSNNEITD